MAAPADLVARLEALGCVAVAPYEHPLSGCAGERWVHAARLPDAAAAAKAAGYFLESMTCTDRLETRRGFELLYTFNRWDSPARVGLRVFAPEGSAVPTLTGVYGIADWNEREAWELYGVEFDGHPDLTWLLLPEGTEFRPLLKSFTGPPPSIYDGRLAAAPSPDDDGTAPAGG